jgi:hypothetical protein
VDEKLIWHTVENDLGVLRHVAESELAALRGWI